MTNFVRSKQGRKTTVAKQAMEAEIKEKEEKQLKKKQKKEEKQKNLKKMEMSSSSILPHVESLTEKDALSLISGISTNTAATEVNLQSYLLFINVRWCLSLQPQEKSQWQLIQCLQPFHVILEAVPR